MTTWKENNLLREAEEKRVYWRWCNKKPSGDRMVIALGVPNKKNEFKVLLRNSSHLARQEFATFTTREDAEAFAAKAFPGEDGEAYIAKGDLDYVEVDTTFGKCLVSRRFYDLYEERLEWNKLNDDEKRDHAVKSFRQDIEEDCKSTRDAYIAYLGGADNIFSSAKRIISNTIRNGGVEVAEKFINNFVQSRTFSPEPVTALIYYMTYYQPEEMEEVFSDKDKIFNRVIDMLKNRNIKVNSAFKREYPKLDINLL